MEVGIHRGLKNLGLRSCGFESRHPHAGVQWSVKSMGDQQSYTLFMGVRFPHGLRIYTPTVEGISSNLIQYEFKSH